MSDRLDYLYSAVEDAQSTIRALDIKIGFLFLVLCAPAPVADKILDVVPNFQGAPLFLRLLVIVTVLVWSLSGFTLFMAVAAIGNAAQHVSGTVPAGTYFGGDLFVLDWTDSLVRRRRLSRRDVVSELARLPQDEDTLLNELTYEKVKLTYIRQIKITRFTSASRLAMVWAPLTLVTALVARFY